MAKDKFSTFPESPGLPATAVVEIVPDDTQELPQVLTALNVSTSGQVRVTTKQGTTATVFVAAGIVFPLRITRVWATGTTATGIRGLV